MRRLLLVATALLAALLAPPAAASEQASTRYAGTLPNGTTWIADVPADWNGTLLLYSHGYNPSPANPPQNAPDPATAEALLSRGYALAGSSYSRPGWALGTAAADQLGTLSALTAQVGRPRRVIAVGTSMGGLVTGLLAERSGHRLDAALATCGLMGGGIDLLNYQLDGAHAIARLLLPGEDVRLVRYASAAEAALTAQRLVAALEQAQGTALGRARAALVTALFHEPGDDDAARNRNLRAVLPFILLGRYDIEQAAGGNASWNAGVSYRALLARSGRLAPVATLYQQAGASLRADLDSLTASADVVPDRAAVRWMAGTSVLGGRLDVPVLTLHTTTDELVPVQHEEEYAEDVRAARSGALLRQAYVERAGHCAFTPAELVAAVEAVEERAVSGRWGRLAQARQLQARAESLGLGPAAFVRFRPAEFVGDRVRATP